MRPAPRNFNIDRDIPQFSFRTSAVWRVFSDRGRRDPSNINILEQRGMDRVLSYGPDGFERMVFLSVLALNVHLLGLRRRERLLEERKRESGRKRRRTKAA